jgi:apolipoprotein N-acyltransferase
MSQVVPSTPPEIRPLHRALGLLATWFLLLLSQPGLVGRDGLGLLAFVALIPWVWVVSLPGPRAKRVEWFVNGLGLCGLAFWMRYLLPWAVLPMGFVPAFYLVAGGVLLRRLAGRYPLALAAPMAWMAAEVVRFTVPAPWSFGWWRMGTLTHADFWFSSGARTFGVWGLSFALAAFAGWVVDRFRKPQGAAWISHVVGLGAPLAMVLAGAFVPAPEMVDGPRVVVLTPGLEQSLKANSADSWHTFLVDPVQSLVEGLAEAREAGEPEPDLVAFGETMMKGLSVEPSAIEAFENGANAPAFTGRVWTPRVLDEEVWRLKSALEVLQGRNLQGNMLAKGLIKRGYSEPWLEALAQGRAPLPMDTPIFSGVEGLVERDGFLWRVNGARIWDANGKPSQLASKVHLVPAAEDPFPAAHMPFLLNTIKEVGGYIPDFVSDDQSTVLSFKGRDGRSWLVGTLICYDNAFDDPFTGVHGGAGVDFHMVASNEAWYERSVLMDHMLAFTRLAAIMSGRAILRATNSGSSALVGPDGRILSLLQQDGEHKMVRGTLRVTVPVPAQGGGAGSGNSPPKTPYVRFWPIQAGLFWLCLAILLFCTCRRLPRSA